MPDATPPGPPPGPRDPGDAWAVGPDGTKAWGRFGAAGLLVDDGAGRVLLQHRVEWSHHGGTWGIPGGARHQGEAAVTAALRESAEEAGVPDDAIALRHTALLDLGFWTYTTVVGRASRPFEPVIADLESLALSWIPIDQVDELPLHPGFGRSWPALRATIATTPHVVVDAANVVGSVPDGWWKDRAGAASRLLAQVSALAEGGVAASLLDLPFARWWPRWTVVLEGEARAAADDAGTGAVDVVRALASGDDAIVESAQAAVQAGDGPVVVVTADRELRDRVEALGAVVHGPSWLRDQL
ncbi:NUDIX domain-containing protein [Curtobacterium flaccumfaciens]|uniref:NUDIX domain-containing protein n=1 Tax=Curtobacterium flaccumfaciens TaxID=2035 RepID=UPI000FFE9DE1|nr:NUDIX domain-containing protein [Curtobacterium flaccumfaciens]MCS0646617.1 NUDIX domain-containing protein [Curtobacterium flaccumfaciens pv. flaccumfaciens]MCS6526008.1 NUDIX domain-containing protein [Curtobacterium flaccumfaciens pv. flaccumfaciens]MCS6528637.1 NUDIX domain-containing protein [Curtobacterium flaccumfaciens pv. flaccumfaciens]NUU11454.1 NUDIX domain-containing protein [Curtobacterium flaccumfaciens]RXF85349.1 NTP pyrophosphohydrolase [Curtobacterium flaccumfaciens pv. fl